MTAAQALRHPWIDPEIETPSHKDLLPNVRKGFDARKTFRKAVEVVKAVNNFSRPTSLNNLLGVSADGHAEKTSPMPLDGFSSTDSLATALKHI
jgi:calcium/calmodulin-dependent protein kinase I